MSFMEIIKESTTEYHYKIPLKDIPKSYYENFNYKEESVYECMKGDLYNLGNSQGLNLKSLRIDSNTLVFSSDQDFSQQELNIIIDIIENEDFYKFEDSYKEKYLRENLEKYIISKRYYISFLSERVFVTKRDKHLHFYDLFYDKKPLFAKYRKDWFRDIHTDDHIYLREREPQFNIHNDQLKEILLFDKELYILSKEILKNNISNSKDFKSEVNRFLKDYEEIDNYINKHIEYN